MKYEQCGMGCRWDDEFFGTLWKPIGLELAAVSLASKSLFRTFRQTSQQNMLRPYSVSFSKPTIQTSSFAHNYYTLLFTLLPINGRTHNSPDRAHNAKTLNSSRTAYLPHPIVSPNTPTNGSSHNPFSPRTGHE